MRACMRAWTEAETDSDIFRHDARNLQLRRRLAERGIDFRGAARSHVTSGRPASGKLLGWNKGLSREDLFTMLGAAVSDQCYLSPRHSTEGAVQFILIAASL